MTLITIKYTLKKDNLYLYKFPLVIINNSGQERLRRIFVEDSEGSIIDLDLDLSEIDWINIDNNSRLRQVFENFNSDIIAELS